MSVTDTAAVIRAIFDTFNQRDLAGTAALASEDLVLEDLGSGFTLRGPDALRQWYEGFLTAGPDAHAALESLVDAGDRAATEHTGTFTHTGPLAGPGGTIPPTGRPVRIRIAEVYHLRDGKVTRLAAYYDLATILVQLGLVSAPAA
jgi:steroid delta-isomerase-like uncharacterized protein